MNKKKLAALLITLLIILPIIFIELVFPRFLSIYSLYQSFDRKTMSFKKNPGDIALVTGVVSKVTRYTTSYGNITIYELDGMHDVGYRINLTTGNADLDVLVGMVEHGMPTHKMGDRVVFEVHFKRYSLDGHRFIAADELFMPLYMVLLDVPNPWNLFNQIDLVPTGPSIGQENAVYLPLDNQFAGIPIQNFTYTLRKANYQVSVINYRSMPFENQPIIEKGNLTDNKTGQSVTFKDIVHTGFLDTGDKIIIKVPPTNSTSLLQMYILELSLDNVVGLNYFFLSWSRGIFTTPYEEISHLYHLTLVSDVPMGDYRQEVIKLVDIPGVLASKVFPLSKVGIAFSDDSGEFGTGMSSHGKCTDTLQLNYGSGSTNPTMQYIDVNKDRRFDDQDEFMVNNTRPYVGYTIGLAGFANDGPEWNQDPMIKFYSGIGTTTEDWLTYSGNWIYVQLNITRNKPWDTIVNISKLYGVPLFRLNNGMHDANNDNLNVSLFKNGVRLVNSDFNFTQIANDDNGTINFTDHDSNKLFNEGDYFKVKTEPGSTYKLVLFCESSPNISGSIEWKT